MVTLKEYIGRRINHVKMNYSTCADECVTELDNILKFIDEKEKESIRRIRIEGKKEIDRMSEESKKFFNKLGKHIGG